jgi:hypothetical protein
LRWCNAWLWITDLTIPILAWQVYSLVYSNLNITFLKMKSFLPICQELFSPFQNLCNNWKCVDFLGWDSFTSSKKQNWVGGSAQKRHIPFPSLPHLTFPLFSCCMRHTPQRVIQFATCLWRTCEKIALVS